VETVIVGAKPNVKIVVVNDLGTFIGVIEELDQDRVELKESLMFNLSQQGISIANHPLFEGKLTIAKKFIICESEPKDTLLEQYEQFWSQKRTGIITAKVMPNKLKGSPLFNIYECFKKYGLEHVVPWEAYKLENNLVVKILPESDTAYPFKVGHSLSFVSFDRYKVDRKGIHPLYVYNLDDAARDMFPQRIKSMGPDGEPQYATYTFKIIEKVDLLKVIDLGRSDYNFDLLNFTLAGTPLNSELLVFMMKEISMRGYR
jgi:hypothetical protein